MRQIDTGVRNQTAASRKCAREPSASNRSSEPSKNGHTAKEQTDTFADGKGQELPQLTGNKAGRVQTEAEKDDSGKRFQGLSRGQRECHVRPFLIFAGADCFNCGIFLSSGSVGQRLSDLAPPSINCGDKVFGGVLLRKMMGTFDYVDLMIREHASEALVPTGFVGRVCVTERDKHRQMSEFVRLLFKL